LIQLRKVLLKNLSNSPFLSASSVAKLCDAKVFNKADLFWFSIRNRFSHSVFVRAELVEVFLEKYYANLRAQVVVIGASDRNFTCFPFVFPNKVHTILCQNNTVQSKNLFTLPLGLENRELGRSGLKRYHRQIDKPKIFDKVFVPPMSPTNPIRRATILKCLDRTDTFDVHTQLLDEASYFEISRKYRFVLCLEGNGFENHRIWETLYRGGVPILLSTDWAKSLGYLNLPMILVDSIERITQGFLRERDKEIGDFSSAKLPQLWTPFWKSIIRSKDVGVLSQNTQLFPKFPR